MTKWRGKNRIQKTDKIRNQPGTIQQLHRTQQVKQCWRKENEEWTIKDIAFVDDWGESRYTELVSELQNTIETGGLAAGAFFNQRLVGFVSVEKEAFGSRAISGIIEYSCIPGHAGAQEYDKKHVEEEPCDCQLEYDITSLPTHSRSAGTPPSAPY